MGRYNFNQRTRDGYEISPEQAAKWLERNDNNRNVTFNAAKSQHIDSGNIRSMANRVQMSEYDMSWTNNRILSAANLIGRVFAGSNLSHEEALSE